MASISALPSDVAEELRASLVVNSLEQCAAELVQNSMDAKATMIEVKIDITGHSLQVSDNGEGIALADIERVGTRYATSKCTSLQDLERITTYGFRGEAVAAIAEMSLMDIVSRTRNQDNVYSTIFKGRDRLYCGRSSKLPRYSHGTTVSVRDLFYKFPVRQRYWSDAATSKLDTELEKVKRVLETLSLVAPQISFTLIDMVKDVKVFSCRKVDSQLHRITSILGQSLSSSLSFVRKLSEDKMYEFSGYFSTTGHYNRVHQYFFLNKRPIFYENLQRAVTQLFQQSTFSKENLAYDEDVRRSRERHPVFVLTLTCPTSEYDICADPSKATIEFQDEDRVLRLIRETVIDFLERQHLLSRTEAATLRKQTTTRKRKLRARGVVDNTMEEALPLEYVSRVKSSRPVRTRPSQRNNRGDEVDSACQTDIEFEDELEFELDAEWMASMLDDGFVSEEVQYDRRRDIGIMLPNNVMEQRRTRTSLPHAVGQRSRPFNTGTSGIWAQDALRKWVNPVFPTAPDHIPSLQSLNLDAGSGEGRSRSRESIEKRASRFFCTGSAKGNPFDIQSLQLSKTCLQQAHVISQLDSKFILCTMEAGYSAPASADVDENSCSRAHSKVLVVIDQHAADERVRVEMLMKEMCMCSSSRTNSAGTLDQLDHTHRLDSMVMIPPLPITLSAREWKLANQHSEWLYRWGIVLNDDRPTPSSSATKSLQDARSDRIQDGTEADPETVIVSQHFSGSFSTDYGPDCGASSLTPLASTSRTALETLTLAGQDQGLQQQPRLGSKVRMMPTKTHIAESDYLQGHVTALPRIVADRCVLDNTLTQDLIKDTISWVEESRCNFKGNLAEDIGDGMSRTNGLQAIEFQSFSCSIFTY
ncbi:DNA mismatch repair protein [Mortierella polycephala]|uniref:DNA mismatch repair protein n=1 Tax=Mortierella polycephala TaxID=41804 RepID=A0A9P6U8J9_9FUNG|nr:DNA mismatch repair protein [Mortierella polycephala]